MKIMAKKFKYVENKTKNYYKRSVPWECGYVTYYVKPEDEERCEKVTKALKEGNFTIPVVPVIPTLSNDFMKKK